MRRRRFVALGLAAIMAMTAMTGCGGRSSAKTDSTTGGDKKQAEATSGKKRLHFELDPDIRNPTHGSQRWKIIL